MNVPGTLRKKQKIKRRIETHTTKGMVNGNPGDLSPWRSCPRRLHCAQYSSGPQPALHLKWNRSKSLAHHVDFLVTKQVTFKTSLSQLFSSILSTHQKWEMWERQSYGGGGGESAHVKNSIHNRINFFYLVSVLFLTKVWIQNPTLVFLKSPLIFLFLCSTIDLMFPFFCSMVILQIYPSSVCFLSNP